MTVSAFCSMKNIESYLCLATLNGRGEQPVGSIEFSNSNGLRGVIVTGLRALRSA